MKDKAGASGLLEDNVYYSSTAKYLVKKLLDVTGSSRVQSSQIIDLYSHWFIMHNAVVDTEVSDR